MEQEKYGTQQVGQTAPVLPWNSITEPGAYVEMGTGELYRIPPEALAQGASLLIQRESFRAPRFVQISENPHVITSKARVLCAQQNVEPSF